MICEVRNGDQEVILKNAGFKDVLAVIQIWIHKDREICYTKPISAEEFIESLRKASRVL